MNASDVITEISYPESDLLDSPVLWMAVGAIVAGLVVVLVGLVGAAVARWLRTPHDQPTAGTAGWDLHEAQRQPRI